MSIQEIIRILKKNGIGVMPTDTIYGLVGSALSKKAVERIYKVRKRERNKPFIVLIGSLNDLKKFHVTLGIKHSALLKKIWPGPVSVILSISDKRQATSNKFKYLHRGAKTLAFRLPAEKWLRNFLKKSGPLVAPSANIAGQLPAKNIKEAKEYFGSRVDPVRNLARASRAQRALGRAISNGVDFYIDKGTRNGMPSTLIEIKR